MCFSATASFVASGVLAGASIVTFANMRKQPTKLFAIIPLLFAVQQAIEGFQWLALGQGAGSLPLAYAFLFFAYLLWPIFLPLAALQAEKDLTRRTLIKVCVGMGIFSATLLGYALLMKPLAVSQVGQCINYEIRAPIDYVLALPYVIAVAGCGLLVRRFWIQMFAALGLIGLGVSYLAFTVAYQSVWCFFAAVLSLCIIMELRQKNSRKKYGDDKTGRIPKSVQ